MAAPHVTGVAALYLSTHPTATAAEVHDAIQAQVIALQRAALISDWLEGLRRRTEIADLYVTAR